VPELDVFPLCLGSNIFGWTADESESFAVLDAYAAAGGNFIDTADSYSAWIDGNRGGEAEDIIGRWMASRGNRDGMVIATKVGQAPGVKGLGADTIRKAAEASLERLQTDRIDLYWSHIDDQDTPLEETLGAFGALLEEEKVLHIGASNHTAPRLAEALEASRREGLARYEALQPNYNLMHRDYEGDLLELCEREGIACVPYYGLARGFLTGKFRPGGPAADTRRERSGAMYLDDPRAEPVLEALDEAAAAHGVRPAAVALAWLRAQPTVLAPIASARTPEQLAELLPMAELELTAGELERLAAASG
jgi:aryl-alcohol dehydrogenase-like predicted oxidoreductase